MPARALACSRAGLGAGWQLELELYAAGDDELVDGVALELECDDDDDEDEDQGKVGNGEGLCQAERPVGGPGHKAKSVWPVLPAHPASVCACG